jgi:uncharacterized repeat protein (TIGR02543 family)
LATVTFYANDGTDVFTQQTIRKETATSLTACGFTRVGYIFIGWAESSGGSGETFADKQLVTLTHNLTLYAQWQKKNTPLSGLFTVNSSGKQVRFSKGNLFYTGSEWGIEDNQYDFRTWSGKDSVIDGVYSATGTASGNTGLFYWSKDAEKACAEVYDGTEATPGDTFFANDASVIGEEWFVLSYDEWTYVEEGRTDAYDKYGMATINTGSCTVKGFVLLPDDWTLPSGCIWNEGYYKGYNTNSYTAIQWAAMETAGAVFFPASGQRNEADVYEVLSDGYYWGSSTCSWSKDDTSFIGFSAYDVRTDPAQTRERGESIRLVTLYQN